MLRSLAGSMGDARSQQASSADARRGTTGSRARSLLRLGGVGIALALLLSAPVVRAAGASPAGAQGASPQTEPCALPKALEAAGEEAEARKAYLKLLEGAAPSCAEEGLKKLNEPKAKSEDCRRGETYEGLGRDEEAVKAYERALETNPDSKCAKAGLNNLGPSDLTEAAKGANSFTGSVIELAGAAVAVAGLALALAFLVLSLARVPWLGRFVRRLPKIGRLIGPRLSIEAIADGAADEKPGVPLAAAIKEYMQRLREEAAAGPSSDYDLDWPAPQEEFADFVSGEPGLQNALKDASDISDQAKTVAALLSLAYTTLPITRITLTGATAPTHDGVGIALGLERNGRLTASTTISSKLTAKAGPTVPDYVQLARPAAVWTQFGIGRILGGQAITPEDAESFGLLRQGLDALAKAEDAEAARAYFRQAIRLDRKNWAAYVGLASIPDHTQESYSLVVDSLQTGLEELERAETTKRPAEAGKTWLTRRRNPKDPAAEKKGLPYLEKPNYYRMAYQLAVERFEGEKRKFDARPEGPTAKKIVGGLIRDANLILDWYRYREYLGKGQFWKRLTPQQAVLREFLDETILPSVEILHAEIDPGAPGSAEAATVRLQLDRRRAEADAGELSYRALYNLACYESRETEEGESEPKRELARAVKYLLDALHEAPARRRKALLARADNDVTLRRVVADGEFKAGRQVFEPVSEQAPDRPRHRRGLRFHPGRGPER